MTDAAKIAVIAIVSIAATFLIMGVLLHEGKGLVADNCRDFGAFMHDGIKYECRALTKLAEGR